jgi:hypothetical protein
VSAPSYRRRDPQPVSRGWELAAAGTGSVLLAVALAALTGLGLASAVWGRGWVWPHGTDTITHVLGGLLHGQPGRGLSAGQLRQVPGPLPVYACVAICELALLSAAVLTALLVARYRRPGDARGGMATRREAQRALGLGQLRGARAIIRPDRYGPTAEGRTRAHRRERRVFHKLRTGRWTVHRPGRDPRGQYELRGTVETSNNPERGSEAK